MPRLYACKNNARNINPENVNPTWIMPNPVQYTPRTSDHLLAADDTSLSIIHNNDILAKLKIYNASSPNDNFPANWGKVFIIARNKSNYVKNMISKAPGHYCDIKRPTKAKVLGRITTTNNKINEAIIGGLKKKIPHGL